MKAITILTLCLLALLIGCSNDKLITYTIKVEYVNCNKPDTIVVESYVEPHILANNGVSTLCGKDFKNDIIVSYVRKFKILKVQK